MVFSFFRYFFSYVLKAKTRQRLLFIAMTGLFLSAFSLIVIQGIMGGLQKGLVARSKSIHGSYLLRFPEVSLEEEEAIKKRLKKDAIVFSSELEIEVMLKNKSYLAPAKIHGIDSSDNLPPFLQNKDFTGLVLGSDLSSKLGAHYLDEIQIIAPGITDTLMGEIPRFVSESISDYLYTELPEVDELEVWTRRGVVENLIRKRGINQIRIYGEIPPSYLSSIAQMLPSQQMKIISWEEMNQALVWSLNLETKVMLFLFMSMSFLVSIAITSGLLIFYTKIRKDLLSFWILGMSEKKVVQLCFKFTLVLSGITVLLGGLSGLILLWIIKKVGPDIVPDIFVERQIPISLNVMDFVIAYFIPFGISFIFSYFSFTNFKKENQSFVSLVRGQG